MKIRLHKGFLFPEPLQRADLIIERGRIVQIVPPDSSGPSDAKICPLENHLIFPGLINSHDHLEFNLFPMLGNPPYSNYLSWSADLHARHGELIQQILQIPLADRLAWGMYKNLLCGVTTVIHHGKRTAELENGVLEVPDCGQVVHSIGLEKGWWIRINALPSLWGYDRRRPIVLHLAEGVDEQCRQEFTRLQWVNLFRRPVIAVHGIALQRAQALKLHGLVWCPVSNLYLYGKTAPVAQWKAHLPIVLGTDATLTGSWNFWSHLRQARALGQLSDEELVRAVTCAAAQLWGLPGRGRLVPHGVANLVVARRKAEDPRESFFALQPEDIDLVLIHGEPRLIAEELEPFLAELCRGKRYTIVRWGSRRKKVRGDLAGLWQRLKINRDQLPLPVPDELCVVADEN